MDKYDAEVARLSAPGENVYLAWAYGPPHSPLFDAATPAGDDWSDVRPDGKVCGCLTQIRFGCAVAWTPALTREIRADTRIPTSPDDVKPEHLPVFAEWQRRIDRELRGHDSCDPANVTT